MIDTLLIIGLALLAGALCYFWLKAARLLSNWMIDQIDRM